MVSRVAQITSSTINQEMLLGQCPDTVSPFPLNIPEMRLIIIFDLWTIKILSVSKPGVLPIIINGSRGPMGGRGLRGVWVWLYQTLF